MNPDIIESPERVDSQRAATFDIGGTLASYGEGISSHKEINTALGLSPEEDMRLHNTYKGERSILEDYLGHAGALTSAIRASDTEGSDLRSYAEAIQNLMQTREIISGAEEFIQSFKDAGYHTVALSSAPMSLTYSAAQELNMDAVYRFRDIEFQGQDFHYIHVNEHGREGKEGIIEAFQEQGKQVIHIGNGGNDLVAAEQADKSVRRWDWVSNPKELYDEAIDSVLTEGSA